MKAVRRVLKWGGFGLLVLMLVLVVINAFDEELEPATPDYLEPVPETYAPQSNVFYALISLDQAGDDWAGVGFKLKQRLDAQMAAGRSGEDVAKELSAELDKHKLAFKGDSGQLGDKDQLIATVGRIRSGKLNADQLLADNQVLLARYLGLYRYEHYANTLAPGWASMSLIPMGAASKSRNLWVLDLAKRVDQGQLDEVAQRLTADTVFWRRMLAHSELTLVDKMVMTAWVRSNFQLASQLAHRYALSSEQLQTLQGMTGPVTAEERSLAGVLRQEGRFVLAFTREMWGKQGWMSTTEPDAAAWDRASSWATDHFARYFFKRNASANRQIRNVQTVIEMDAHECTQYQPDESTLAQRPDLRWWWFFYDPIGKALIEAAGNGALYHSYTGRMCDLVGFQRVLALQLELRKQKVADADIDTFIRRGGAAYADPFTGQPMQWLPKDRSLTFGAVDKLDGKRLPWPI